MPQPSGSRADPAEPILELHTDRALPGEISFLCKTSYTLGYYSTTTQKRETPSEQEKKLTLPVGSTDARVAVDSRSGYCMGRSSSSRRLLIPGYYFLSEYDRTTGTSHVAGDVTVSKVTASGLPEGSFEVSYSVVLK